MQQQSVHVVMPRLGLTMKQGRVERWFKQDGDRVQSGDPLLEVLTEKVTSVVKSPADGVLRVLVPAGRTVPVGTPLAAIELTAEPVTAPGPRAGALGSTASAPAGGWVPATPAARRLARELGVDLASVRGSGPGGRITEEDVRAAAAVPSGPGEERAAGVVAASGRQPGATPLARAVAADLGVDLGEVAGSGPAGKITRDDVLRSAGRLPPGTSGTGAGAWQEVHGGIERVPLAGRRRVIAERMAASAASTAPVTLTTTADMTRVREVRELLMPEVEARTGVRLTYTDIVIRVVALGLREHPYMNASLEGDSILLHARVNVGLAVDAPDGLLVPVIRDADRLGVAEIARVRHRLVDGARAGNLSPDDLVGGTFTVTNLGMYDIEAFSPIINPPEAAILGVGRIEDRPVAAGGQVVVRPVCCLSLVFDHRVVDGGPAARFLQWVRSRLENPCLLLL